MKGLRLRVHLLWGFCSSDIDESRKKEKKRGLDAQPYLRDPELLYGGELCPALSRERSDHIQIMQTCECLHKEGETWTI